MGCAHIAVTLRTDNQRMSDFRRGMPPPAGFAHRGHMHTFPASARLQKALTGLPSAVTYFDGCGAGRSCREPYKPWSGPYREGREVSWHTTPEIFPPTGQCDGSGIESARLRCNPVRVQTSMVNAALQIEQLIINADIPLPQTVAHRDTG